MGRRHPLHVILSRKPSKQGPERLRRWFTEAFRPLRDSGIYALARYLPDGPGFSKPELWSRKNGEQKDEKNRLMDALVETWKAYLNARSEPTTTRKQELVSRLYQVADAWKDAPSGIYASPALRWEEADGGHWS